MIEMWVRTVDHEPRTGAPVVVLLPRVAGRCQPLALPVPPADACTLSHELQGMTTLRTRAFMLLDQALAAVQAYATDIALAAQPDGSIVGQVTYWHLGGPLRSDVDVSLALGLAAHLGFVVQVPESLLPSPVAARSIDLQIVDQSAPLTETPAVFRRAFEE
jgi:hypothetical protein